MEKEINEFVQAINAKEPTPGTRAYAIFRSLFKRRNYFIFDETLIIVKVSRSAKPFFGVSKALLDVLNGLDYLVILLVSGSEGWVYGRGSVGRNIEQGRWNLRNDDNQYKINHYALRKDHCFNNIEHFLTMVRNKST
jgi:hypothetical protein